MAPVDNDAPDDYTPTTTTQEPDPWFDEEAFKRGMDIAELNRRLRGQAEATEWSS